MRVETERMYLYPLSDEEMRLVIEKESDPEMKQAYTEMLEGCLSNPDKRIWYAIWNMELKFMICIPVWAYSSLRGTISYVFSGMPTVYWSR